MASRLCLFDLDRTLVPDRTALRVAARVGREDAVRRALKRADDALVAGRSTSGGVMAAFEGLEADIFEAACAAHELRPGAEEAVRGMRALGFSVGIVTATYRPAAEAVQRALGLDFVHALDPEVEEGRLTGRLLAATHLSDCADHLCKGAVLDALRDQSGAAFAVAVGDGLNDLCMFEAADMAVAVEPSAPEVRVSADVVVRDLRAIPVLVAKRLSWSADGETAAEQTVL